MKDVVGREIGLCRRRCDPQLVPDVPLRRSAPVSHAPRHLCQCHYAIPQGQAVRDPPQRSARCPACAAPRSPRVRPARFRHSARHRLPLSLTRMLRSSARSRRSTRSRAAISMPGVQYPHCRASWREKAARSSVAISSSSRPSIVTMITASALERCVAEVDVLRVLQTPDARMDGLHRWGGPI
jgi:hypothetical protein